MKLKCDVCGGVFDSNEAKCPSCKEPQDVGAIFRRMFSRAKRATGLVCPECRRLNNPKNARCEHCGSDLTISVGMYQLVFRVRQAWENFKAKHPQFTRNWRITHFALSVFALVIAYKLLKPLITTGWDMAILYTIAMLVFGTMVLMWTVPQEKRHAFYVSLTPSTRLSLVLNYFTFLLLFHAGVIVFKEQVAFIVTGVLITHASIFLVFGHAYDWWAYAGYQMFHKPDNRFDPTAEQGRGARRN